MIITRGSTSEPVTVEYVTPVNESVEHWDVDLLLPLQGWDSPEGSSRVRVSLNSPRKYAFACSTVAARLRPRGCFPARPARSNLNGPSRAGTEYRPFLHGYSTDWVPPFASDLSAGTWFLDFLSRLWTRSACRARRLPSGEHRHNTV
ncbi:MAG: hypothetical protein J07HQX50_00016 [Haloquadratum sp. J07HQX50]|nr:MAG: hypothetical protein J07HQX50_00016 [Haloquadratum sp. J07HQX50]